MSEDLKMPRPKGMKISLIVAIGKNNGIGRNKELPWRLPTDLARFKELTLGHHIIMGRKTFESIGRPLPGRDSIVITQNRDYSYPVRGVFVVHSMEEALRKAFDRGEDEVFVIGGGMIYEEALPFAHMFYITEVDYNGDADTFFPDYSRLGLKAIKEESFPATEKDPFRTTFRILESDPAPELYCHR